VTFTLCSQSSQGFSLEHTDVSLFSVLHYNDVVEAGTSYTLVVANFFYKVLVPLCVPSSEFSDPPD